jgi:hypothetical protein
VPFSRWESALPATDFVFLAVLRFLSNEDALLATFLLVTFLATSLCVND